MGTCDTFLWTTHPPLPSYRVSQSRPFTVTGVDYAGPLYVKEGTQIDKRYIALYTCASTRAVHLEVAEDLSAEAFLRTLQRFSARRSYPQMLISDNGTNFVSSAKTLKSWEEHHSVRSTLNQNKCKWHFNPSRAPWFGGFFERIVKMVKLCLQKTLHRSMVTEDELHTVLCEIEADLNDRPLTSVSDSVDDLQPLTPSQLMLGYRLDSTPVATLDPEEELDPSEFTTELLSRRQKNVQKVLHRFQSRFRKEYLTILRHSATDTREVVAPQVGDIVQIHDEGPRLLWNLGRVVELHEGKDGHVRSVKLKTRGGTVSRPVTLLYPLEIRAREPVENSPEAPGPELTPPPRVDESNIVDSGGSSTSTAVSTPSAVRPPRAAAVAASKRFATQLQ